MNDATNSVALTVNGKPYNIRTQELNTVYTSLLEYLRYTLNFKGSKAGCNEGGCGACTVMIQKNGKKFTINACITPVLSLDGCQITTVEGVGTVDSPHVVQSRIAHLHGSQCGFCTPGMVMSLYTLLQNNPSPDSADVENVFNGNLCRCTGYRPLLDAAKTFAIDIEDVASNTHPEPTFPPLSDNALDRVVTSTVDKVRETRLALSPKMSTFKMAQNRPQLNPPAPPAVVLTPSGSATRPTVIEARDGTTWVVPDTTYALQECLTSYPKCRLVSGNAGFLSLHREVMSAQGAPPVAIWLGQIKEMNELKFNEGTCVFTIGSAVTIANVQEYLSGVQKSTICKSKSAFFNHALTEFKQALGHVGSTQTRNGMSFVGHALGRPCGDLVPMLVAMKAELLTTNNRGQQRRVLLLDLTGPGGLGHQEVVLSIDVPVAQDRFTGQYKVALRRDNCHGAMVVALSAGFRQKDGEQVLDEVALYCTGPSHFLTTFGQAAHALNGTPITQHFLPALRKASDMMLLSLRNEMHPAPEGRHSYRMTVGRGLLYRLFASIQQLTSGGVSADLLMQGSDLAHHRIVTEGIQSWEVTKGHIHDIKHQDRSDTTRTPVGDALPVLSALQQATGQAIYVDDIPTPAGCLFAAAVKSTIPRGSVKLVNPKKALDLPGVVGYFDYKDIPNKTPVEDNTESVFIESNVHYVGDIIGLVVAMDHITACRAAALVEVQYREFNSQAIFTIAQAIEASSYYPFDRAVVDGDSQRIFDSPGNNTILTGVLEEGGQEHFYMEPHALLVCPGEKDDIEVFSMTQCVMKSQKTVAKTLGIPESRVIIKVKRLGGGFGGKEVRTTYMSAALAVAAMKLRRPVRWLIERQEDMRITGGRHPFRAEWRCAVDASAKKIVAIDVKLYANGGSTDSATSEVMGRALMHICNAYKIPNVAVKGFCCKTNIVSNTAFRGFGAPQAMLVAENMIEAAAIHLGLPIESIQRSHLMKQNEHTHFGQIVPHCKLGEMWGRVIASSAYVRRAGDVETFNRSNRWVKRGIAITPTLYGINFPVRHLNQSSAYVCVYTDGSAVVHHGAVEMGQGINVKVAQVAARALGIPVEKVTVGDTNSTICPNTPPTAASMGSDLSCMAVLDACDQIRARLAPFISAEPTLSFKDICAKAWKQRISLSAEGFYKTESGSQYDWKMVTLDNSRRGPAFNYFSFGVGVSEIELDVMTGVFRVVRADLLMDCGESLNPTVDIGQVEGSYVQGMGWLTTEELIFGDSAHPQLPPGQLYNAGPYSYKIPTAADIPIDFRVELLSGAPNAVAVHASKAVGEPPFFLAASVYSAIKRAVYSARRDEGIKGYVSLNSPLTAERIRMACRDEFTLGTYSGEEYTTPGSF